MAQQPTANSSSPGQSQSLYRKYRPTSFDPSQLVGQEHVARTLRNAIVLDRVAHAYLFCGPRGTGKTSTARLLAKAVNCLDPDPANRPCNACDSCRAINQGSVVDIIEIDAASNRGVDDIRDLREKVRYAPTQLSVKFYIIDEAHQLTRDAFNAFLKTLEEPPGHVKFVLATTEAEKLPDTVASRCQRFDFRRIPVESALQHLRNVCEWEDIDAEEEALLLIARRATGSLRDALGLLDQLALYGERESDRRQLSAETVRQVLGLSRNDRLVGLINAIADQDAGEGLRLVTEASDQGEDVHQLNRQLIGYLRLLMHIRAGGSPPEADAVAKELAAGFELDQLSSLVRTFTNVDAAANRSSYPQLPLELAVVRAVLGEPNLVKPAPEPETRATSPAATAAAPATTRKYDVDKSPASRPSRPEPARRESQERPAQREKSPEKRPEKTSGPINATLEHLLANWSHIRRDVKAENSRIAALLSSADPAAVTADKVILAAPYEFHRNKLNEDSTRLIVERVLQQYTHSDHQLICMAPDEIPVSDDNAGNASAPRQAERSRNTRRPERTEREETRSASDEGGSESTAPVPTPESRGKTQGPADDGPGLNAPDGASDSMPIGEVDLERGASERPASRSDDQSGGTGDQAEIERVEAAKRIFEAREK